MFKLEVINFTVRDFVSNLSSDNYVSCIIHCKAKKDCAKTLY